MIPAEMEALLVFAFVLGLVVLSNYAEEHPRWSLLVSAAFAVLVSLTGLIGGMETVGSLVGMQILATDSPSISVGITLLLSSLVGGLLLVPAVRRRLSSVLPLRADSPVHLAALMLSLYLVSWSFLNLFWMGGLDGLLANVEEVPLGLYAAQAAGFALLSFAGVGLLTRRSLTQAVERLGLEGLSWAGLLVSSVAVIFLLMVEFVVAVAWMLIAPEQAELIGEISEMMLGELDSLGKILLLSLLSSVSEEVLFRGALQPRLGIALSSVLFAVTHLQYAISPATLVVLLIGFVLGLLRRYFGTWAAILTHFCYNFGLMLLAMIARQFVEPLLG